MSCAVVNVGKGCVCVLYTEEDAGEWCSVMLYYKEGKGSVCMERGAIWCYRMKRRGLWRMVRCV